MNEPTNRPIVVGFGSVPGGTGCTTLAIHAATFAARKGLHTLAISIDPSADMLRRLGCDEACIDGHCTKEKRLKLAFVPPETYLFSVVEYLPNLGFGGEVGNPEIIILDLGPGLITPPLLVRADFWVVPIQDSRSLGSIEQRRFPMGITETLFVLSRVPLDASRRLLGSTRDCLKTVNRARLLNSIVPSSGLLRRTASERKTIWELTSRSLTTRKVEGFCRELLDNILGKTKTEDEIARCWIVKPDSADAATLKAVQELFGDDFKPSIDEQAAMNAEIERLQKEIQTATELSVSNGVRPSRRSKKGGT